MITGVSGNPRSDVDTVLCDVGDVIIRFDPAVAARIESRHGLSAGSLLPTALKSPPARLAMAGGIDYESWRQAIARALGEAAVTEWLDYHGEANHEVVELLKALKNNNVRVVLLSNATRRLWADLAHHGLDGLADAVFCSADIRAAKPDPASYRHAAAHGAFDLRRGLYVDDTASWVAAGQDLGLRGHVFVTAQGLQEELTDLGLLP
ncbi:HAD-IA family hydrolase (plasmid) [Kitasatospora sp. NBC_00374]|uniref:HAD family hydrolase n=1 Tax=Kitasatospora sp. NBC_00374 TaxID=2975964 RepID=UPI0030E0D81B